MKKTEYLSIRTNTEIKKKVEEMAKKEDRTISYIINRCLEKYFKKKQQ